MWCITFIYLLCWTILGFQGQFYMVMMYDPSTKLVISGFQYFIRIFGSMFIKETAYNFLWCFCLVSVSWWCLPHRRTLEVFPLLLCFGRIYEGLNYVQKEIKETLPFTIVANKLFRNKFTQKGKDLCTKNYKTLMKEIIADTNICKGTMC